MSEHNLPPSPPEQGTPVSVPPPGPAATPKQTSALAIVSLVAGLLGWTLLPFLGSLGAIICGHMARAEIRRSPATLDGDGLAVGGLILGWAMVILSVLTVVAVIVFFGGLAVLLGALGMSGQL